MIDESVRRDILAQMGGGESLRAICRKPGMPHVSTVMRDLAADPDFSEQYARAMLVRADLKFDELDEIGQTAEETDSAVKIAGLRLKADNIKWQLARMNAKKYGDKLTTEVNGTLQHDHTVGLQPETAQFLDSMRAGSGNPGSAPPVPD